MKMQCKAGYSLEKVRFKWLDSQHLEGRCVCPPDADLPALYPSPVSPTRVMLGKARGYQHRIQRRVKSMTESLKRKKKTGRSPSTLVQTLRSWQPLDKRYCDPFVLLLTCMFCKHCSHREHQRQRGHSSQ
jgi:hypothetical protein